MHTRGGIWGNNRKPILWKPKRLDKFMKILEMTVFIHIIRFRKNLCHCKVL